MKLIVAFLLSLACVVLSSDIVGGFKHAPIEDCKEAAVFAVTEMNANGNSKKPLDKMVVEKCEKQLVAGTNFRIQVSFAGEPHTYAIHVFRHLGAESKYVINKVEKSAKRPMPGSWRDVNFDKCKDATEFAVQEWNKKDQAQQIGTFAVTSCKMQLVHGLNYRVSLRPAGAANDIEFIVHENFKKELKLLSMVEITQESLTDFLFRTKQPKPVMGGWKNITKQECAKAAAFAVSEWNEENFDKVIGAYEVNSCMMQRVNGNKYRMVLRPVGTSNSIQFEVVETTGRKPVFKLLSTVELKEEEKKPVLGQWKQADKEKCAEAAKFAVSNWNEENFDYAIGAYEVNVCKVQLVHGVNYHIELRPINTKDNFEFKVHGTFGPETEFKMVSMLKLE